MDKSWVRGELIKRGISTQDLATAWGKSRPVVTRWMGDQKNGRYELTVTQHFILAKMLDMDVVDLYLRLGYDKVQQPPVASRMRAIKGNSHEHG